VSPEILQLTCLELDAKQLMDTQHFDHEYRTSPRLFFPGFRNEEKVPKNVHGTFRLLTDRGVSFPDFEAWKST
jgi:hypothetical protein